MHLKISSAKWRLFRLGLNELREKAQEKCHLRMFFISKFEHCVALIMACCMHGTFFLEKKHGGGKLTNMSSETTHRVIQVQLN